ncbi:MAG: alanine--tRNA ligase [Gammaproteobacteria bacterium]|nr:alanine--tRNA ligase [Gammaproteobacteria bacterium]
MDSAALRSTFLDYFDRQDHEIVPGSSLVPANDPTLLFTNAGMVQFKDVFLGNEERSYQRATSAQRCVRAGGKHNDLENVGYTARHHTFFEMLGNFSFGDYFKREAIEYAWEFVTGVLGIPPAKLWVTVFEEDDEAASIWLDDINIDALRFSRMGAKDNFWAMGDTGPCGPCSEIFYDHGPGVKGGPPGSAAAEGDRFVEIWNLVFMQFDRDADGNLTRLPKPSVDTGLGLERVAAVMQGVQSNYDIDLFRRLIDSAAALTGTHDTRSSSLRVIADHIRACAFLIVDGVLPSNEGRGYVLRRIIRRAVRHGYQLGVEEPFFHALVEPLDKEMGEAYPELTRGRQHAERVLKQEEIRFAETLTQGMRMLEENLANLSDNIIPGETIFRLYDTFGFPVDLTADIARERGLGMDKEGFNKAMEAQRQRARAASRFAAGDDQGPRVDAVTSFTGYELLEDLGAITGLVKGNESARTLQAGDEGTIFLDRTPFYAESGGQVGDAGKLLIEGAEFKVSDTRKQGKAHAHIGVVESGEFHVGDEVRAVVDRERRVATVLNHSATHLLHAALRHVLGEHVTQKGSLVAPDRLRFDFSHYEPVGPGELSEIEALINREIRRNVDAEVSVVPYEEALQAGALALFGEKYEERVRVLRIGDFSAELCGGTHVRRAGDIGLFKIVSESGIAAGIRRIEAVTGQGALDWVNAGEQALKRVAAIVKGSRDDAEDKVRQLAERARQLERELERLQSQLAGGSGVDLAERAVDVNGVKVLAARLDGASEKVLRDTVDRLKNQLGSAVVLLSAVEAGKVRLIAGVTRNCTDRLDARVLANRVAGLLGGRGGGRPDLAQAGASDASRLDEALEAVPGWVGEQLQSASAPESGGDFQIPSAPKRGRGPG